MDMSRYFGAALLTDYVFVVEKPVFCKPAGLVLFYLGFCIFPKKSVGNWQKTSQTFAKDSDKSLRNKSLGGMDALSNSRIRAILSDRIWGQLGGEVYAPFS